MGNYCSDIANVTHCKSRDVPILLLQHMAWQREHHMPTNLLQDCCHSCSIVNKGTTGTLLLLQLYNSTHNCCMATICPKSRPVATILLLLLPLQSNFQVVLAAKWCLGSIHPAMSRFSDHRSSWQSLLLLLLLLLLLQLQLRLHSCQRALG